MDSPAPIPESPFLEPEDTYQDYDTILDSDFDVLPGRRLHKMVSQEREKLTTFVSSKRRDLRLRVENPPAMKTRDKISFLIGIIDVCSCFFILGGYPHLFLWKYSIQLPLLLSIRYVYYRKMKHHYFLLDFCYFANLLVILYLHVFPHSCSMFQLAFAFTAGPLSWAVGVWRNSMVFHSIDKITSLFIHVSPSLVVWCLRWRDHPNGNWNRCEANGGYISFYDATIFPLLPYVFWQFVYYVIVQVIRKGKFKRDKERLTSFLWMQQDTKHVVNKWMSVFGKKNQVIMFGVLQLIFTFVTMLPIKLLYQNFWAHTIWLMAIGTLSAWNGSSFYFEVFSKRYQDQMEEYAKHWKTVSDVLKANPQVGEVKTGGDKKEE